MGKEAPPYILYRWVSDSEQAGEQGNQHGADHGNTCSGHELYHGELVVKGFPIIKKQGLSHLYEVELYSFNRI